MTKLLLPERPSIYVPPQANLITQGGRRLGLFNPVGYNTAAPNRKKGGPTGKKGGGGSGSSGPGTFSAYTGYWQNGPTGNKTVSTPWKATCLVIPTVGMDVDDTNSGSLMLGIGLVDSALNQYSVGANSSDADGTQDACSIVNSKAIDVPTTGSSSLHRAAVTSFGNQGFVINSDVVTFDTVGHNFLALAGSQLQQKVVSLNIPNGTTGDVDTTSVGFQPDVIIFTSGPTNATLGAYDTFGGAHMMIGAADSAGRQWVYSWWTRDLAGTSNTFRYYNNDRMGAIFQGTGGAEGTLQCSATFVSMLSNGFRLNLAASHGLGNGWRINALCLKGISARVDTYTRATTATPFTTNVTAPGFRPKAVLQVGSLHSAAGIADNVIAGISVSAANGSRSTAWYDQDNVSTSVSKRRYSAKAGMLFDNGNVLQQATLSFTPTGFDMLWDIANATFSSIQGYVALG